MIKVVEEFNMELVMDVAVESLVNKEVAKVVEEVNKEFLKEVKVYFWSVHVVLWCWTRKLTWRSTRRVIRKWPMLSTSFLMSEQFEGPYGNYKLEKRHSACELCAKTFSCGNNLKMHIKANCG